VDFLNPYVCLACKADYELAFDGKCCTGKANNPKKYFFDPTLLKCAEILNTPTAIQSKNLKTGVVSCIQGELATGGLYCCPLASFYKTSATPPACTPAATATNCELFEAVETDAYSNCLKCKPGF